MNQAIGEKGKRKAHHPYETKDQLISRLKRIEGQIRGISRMIQEDIYCDDILHQMMSVGSALQGVKQQLFEAHLRSCVLEQIRDGKDDVVDELLTSIATLAR